MALKYVTGMISWEEYGTYLLQENMLLRGNLRDDIAEKYKQLTEDLP